LTVGLVAMAALLLLGASAPGNPPNPDPVTSLVASSESLAAQGGFAGRVPGGDLYLLIAVDARGKATAHACDQGTTAAWFVGHASGNQLDLGGGAARLVAVAEAGRINGTLRLDEASHPFALTPVGRGFGRAAAYCGPTTDSVAPSLVR
jgi:hypothetical protein